MRSRIHLAMESADAFIARTILRHRAEPPGLISFLFHGIFTNESEISRNLCHPQQSMTVSKLRVFIEHFLEHGYLFVSEADLLGGLRTPGKYVLATFDDGYYNNVRALPVLREFGIPASVFVSARHVELGRCFWWDVLYREAISRGSSLAECARKEAQFKERTHDEIERSLVKLFGNGAFLPRSDVDRPFSPDELRDLAREPGVFVGNHTMDHAILTNYRDDHMTAQISDAQQALTEMTGRTPLFISYPNGNVSPRIVAASLAAGLKLGITVRSGRDRVPLDDASSRRMLLRRQILWGDTDIGRQCVAYRSGHSLLSDARRVVGRPGYA